MSWGLVTKSKTLSNSGNGIFRDGYIELVENLGRKGPSRYPRILKGANIDETEYLVRRLLSASKAKGYRSEACCIKIMDCSGNASVASAPCVDDLVVCGSGVVHFDYLSSVVAMASKNARHEIVNELLVRHFCDPGNFLM
jgi:hypothetical protein